MKKNSTLLLFYSIAAIYTNGQSAHQSLGSPCNNMGAYSLNHTDVFSFSANQASLAQLKSASAGVYGERRFLLNELNNYIMAAGFLTKSGNIGFKAGYYGSAIYNETQLGLAYARRLGSKMDIGVQFNYNNIGIGDMYGKASTVSVEAGMILHLTDKIHAGLHINNPVGGKLGKERKEKLPSVYSFGFGYDASEKLLVSAEIIKEENQPVNVVAGISYKFIPQLTARLGISSATSSVWTGLGLSIKTFRIYLTSVYHPLLGITPGLSLLFNFNGKPS